MSMLKDEVIGQQALKNSIEIAMKAAHYRNEPMGHILLCGQGGLGKTHILNAICTDLGYHKVLGHGNHFKREDLPVFFKKACLEAKTKGTYAFIIIDEIHQLSTPAQEELYYILDYNAISNKGEKELLASRFTFVGATTEPQELSQKSLINRISYFWTLEEMSDLDIIYLVNYYYMNKGMNSKVEQMQQVARRSRGNPRIALKYAARIRDYAHADGRRSVNNNDVIRTFSEFGIDELGLDKDQRQYLAILYGNDKPVGLESLANMLGEKSPEQVQKMIEPYLMKKGLIFSTSRGRELTDKGHCHIMQSSGLSGELDEWVDKIQDEW